MISEILQLMFWLREEFATDVSPASLERFTGRSVEEAEEWLELMAERGLVQRERDLYRLTDDGIADASRLLDR